MKCAIYIRVSTKLQEERYSLSAQQSELTNYANKQDWHIVGEFKDVESGGKLNKKGLNQLLDYVEEGRIDVVLCIDQDRLSRLDTVGWEYLKSTLRENDVKIAEPGSITDLANEDQEFISDIKNLIARREKKSVVRRMMRGKRQMMREGKPWGKTPIGYTYSKETKEYSIDDKWAWVIPYIDKLYLEDQLGMKAIADRLNEISKSPSGTMWNQTLVHRRLISKAFHGVMEKKFENGEVITIEDMYPPLRTRETYDLIQEERTKRGKLFKVTSRRRPDVHILRRTLITCGHCGRKLGIQQNGLKESPVYYVKHGRKMRLSDRSTCDISVNTIRFEYNLTAAIKEILSGEDLAKKYIKLETKKSDVDEIAAQLKDINKSIETLHEKIDKLLDLYLDADVKLSKEKLVERQKSLENELEFQQKRQRQLEAKLATLKKNEWNYNMIYQYLEVAKDFDTELTALEQTQLVGRLFPTAKMYSDKIIMIAEIGDVPVEVEVPINEDLNTWHHTKQASYKEKYRGKL
ncbi:recombinase family protein [Alkalihalobacterium alkalinitrilicum]|uniref:recombinase family protein n=1 Tax=Alkalihalobacterium alkalinitrilicum TaxID=427920 RepID=UPI000995D8B4|nr:recombinase family protein [Alkalihalobacterium alkalinitrilicum]